MVQETIKHAALSILSNSEMRTGDVKNGALHRWGENDFRFVEAAAGWVGNRATQRVWKDRRYNIRLSSRNDGKVRLVVELDGRTDRHVFERDVTFWAAVEKGYDRLHELLIALDMGAKGKGGRA